MRQKIGRWQLLFVVGIMLILVVVMLMTSGGLKLGSGVLAEKTYTAETGNSGSGIQPSSIIAASDKTTAVMPAGLSDTGIFGKVGIGTGSPVRILHIVGNVCLFERSQNSAGFIINRTGVAIPNRWVFGVDEDQGPTHFSGFVIKTYPYDGAPASEVFEQLVITKDDYTTPQNEGRVGIGTSSPDSLAKLHVVNVSTTDEARAVYGETTAASGSTYGVYGKHTSGNYGYLGGSDYGVYGEHSSGNYGELGTATEGVFGYSSSGNAGKFEGDVDIVGNLTKSTGEFKIDHPLDPENKYLQHSFVESPDMMNIYIGNTVLDEKGEALVELPSYFQALNRDFTYKLTCIGSYAAVYVAEEVSNNHFKIAGGKPGMKVSWQVTGVRQDPYAKAHPIQVELEKPANEKGYYLHPKEWGQPEDKGIGWAQRP